MAGFLKNIKRTVTYTSKAGKHTAKAAVGVSKVGCDFADGIGKLAEELHKNSGKITTDTINLVMASVKGMGLVAHITNEGIDEGYRLAGFAGMPDGVSLEKGAAYRRYLEGQIDGIKILIKQLKKSTDPDKDQKILVLKLRKKDLEKNGDWVGFNTPKLP